MTHASSLTLNIFLRLSASFSVKIMFTVLNMLQLEDRASPYVDETGSIIVRFNLLSTQSTPLTLRSVPRFDYQQQHLLKARLFISISFSKPYIYFACAKVLIRNYC
jgi:hypothetical protein